MKVAKLQLEGSGSSLVVRVEDAECIKEHLEMAAVGEKFTITIDEMSQEELAALLEFDGW